MSSLRLCRYKKLVDAFFACDRFTFPNTCVLLHLVLTMPITKRESECSFSQLNLLKTPHCSTTSAPRLGSLALMEIKKKECSRLQEPYEIEKVVQSFYGIRQGVRGSNVFCLINNKLCAHVIKYGNGLGLTPSGHGLSINFSNAHALDFLETPFQ